MPCVGGVNEGVCGCCGGVEVCFGGGGVAGKDVDIGFGMSSVLRRRRGLPVPESELGKSEAVFSVGPAAAAASPRACSGVSPLITVRTVEGHSVLIILTEM